MTALERKAVREAINYLHRSNTQKDFGRISSLVQDSNMSVEHIDTIDSILNATQNKQLKCEEWLLALLEE